MTNQLSHYILGAILFASFLLSFGTLVYLCLFLPVNAQEEPIEKERY
jgi:hypothetical protein